MDIDALMKRARMELKRVFGYSDFRPGQEYCQAVICLRYCLPAVASRYAIRYQRSWVRDLQ